VYIHMGYINIFRGSNNSRFNTKNLTLQKYNIFLRLIITENGGLCDLSQLSLSMSHFLGTSRSYERRMLYLCIPPVA
jgi:hypothetical protein